MVLTVVISDDFFYSFHIGLDERENMCGPRSTGIVDVFGLDGFGGPGHKPKMWGFTFDWSDWFTGVPGGLSGPNDSL